jgi:hypothetical protein
MDIHLKPIVKEVYEKCGLNISNYETETESKDYAACRFYLSGRQIISRNAKITPKKMGQFVTLWQRNAHGIIEPLKDTDPTDFYVVNVSTENEFGQFVFPKSALAQKGILSTANKEGKRAFRVYPIWDLVSSKQAKRTQEWQLEYFYPLAPTTDLKKVLQLYSL